MMGTEIGAYQQSVELAKENYLKQIPLTRYETSTLRKDRKEKDINYETRTNWEPYNPR